MKNTEQQAVWKPYPDYPFVEANQFGEIRTKDRVVTRGDGRKQFVKGRILKQQRDRHGYMRVHIRANGKEFLRLVSRIVAITFIPNPDNLPEVNHKDNDPTNNAVSNLEWCTHKYNIAYREKYGTSAAEAFGRSIIAINLDSFKVIWFESQREAERQLRACNSSINKVVKDQRNTAGGYWFCYADSTAVEKIRAKFGDKIAEKVEKLLREHL